MNVSDAKGGMGLESIAAEDAKMPRTRKESRLQRTCGAEVIL
jgi:hypothetical protein